MADQTQRLEVATVRAEVGSSILYRFSNDAVDAAVIPTESGDITNLKKVILDIQTEGAEKISFATTIYPTTAAGIAATTNGAIFLVASSDADEIYAVYSNNAGTAVDTGKRAISGAAVTAAVDTATTAAASAQTAADTATARVAGFHSPSATDPTTRDDGTALQIGDTYFNTASQSTRIYSNSGWVAQALDAAYLSANEGASRVGKNGGGTVQDAVDSIAGKESTISPGTNSQYWRGDKTFQDLNKAAVGLSNVDNTADASKPISTAAQSALDAKLASALISANGGAAIVGTSRGATVESEITSLLALAPARTTVVDSVAALRTVVTTRYIAAQSRGYYAPGDAGGGFYWYDATDTTSADNGFNVIVGTTGARWKLIHDGWPHIEQSGAKPDGATNCVANLQTMLSSASVGKVRFGIGPYAISGNVSVPSSKSLEGIEGGVSKINWSGVGSILLRSSTRVSGLRIDCTGQTAGTWLFNILTSEASVEYVTLQDLYVFSCKGFMNDGNHATNLCTNLRIRNISSRLTKGPGFLFNDVFAFLEMRDVAMDFVGNTVAQNFTGFNITANEGCYLHNCEFTGLTGIVAGTTAAQLGYSFTNCKAIYMDRSFTDAAGGNGMRFTSCQYVRLVQCTNSLCDDVGLYMSSCTDVQITNHYIGGRKGISGATAGIAGAYFLNCIRVSWGGLGIVNVTGDCVNTSGTTQIQLSNGSLTNATGRGLVTASGSIGIYNNLLFAANAAGNYSLGASLDFLTGCQNSAGALLNVTGPGTA